MAFKQKVMTPLTAAGAGPWFPLDYRAKDGSQVVFSVDVSGTLTYKVELTLSNLQDSTVTPVAFDHDTIVAKTASSVGNVEYVPTGLRLNVTAFTSGSATLTVVQST